MTVEGIIAYMDRLKEFESDKDGFLCFSAANSRLIPAGHLRVIADELDRRNADWKRQIDQDLEELT